MTQVNQTSAKNSYSHINKVASIFAQGRQSQAPSSYSKLTRRSTRANYK